jgi:hypothetical protein
VSSNRTTGQALLEFALVVPLFLALLMGVVELGRVVWASDTLASAARDAARFAIVHGGSASDPCPVGPLYAGYGAAPTASASCPWPAPSKQAIRDAASGAVIAGGSGLSVTVCYGPGCSGDTDVAGASDEPGTPVTVVVTSQLSLIVPSLLQLGSFTVTGTATMLVSH